MARLALTAGRSGPRSRLGIGLLAAVLALGCASPQRPTAVVVVDVDTLRADALGCYGNPRATSPNLDAFSAGATRFEWAIAQAPYTLPSQVSILTSLYPWSHGVLANDARLEGEATTLGELFQRGGWRTAAFVDGGFLKAQYGIDQGFDEFTDLDGGGLARGEPLISAWLDRRAPGEKFLLFVHTYDVHSPYAPPEPYRSRFAALVAEPTPGFEPTTDLLESLRASQWGGPLRQLAPNDLAYARALYEAEVASVDGWFGRFLAQLERRGFAGETVIALVSDHGEEFQEHGSVLHEKLYTTVTRVPLIVRSPGGARGVTIDGPVEMVDLLPTLLELAGLPPHREAQGRSLAGAVRAGIEPELRPAVSMSPFYGEQRGILDRVAHLVLTLDSARPELYFYRADRSEQDERAERERARTAMLARLLRERIESHPLKRRLSDKIELSDETTRSLRALGYLR